MSVIIIVTNHATFVLQVTVTTLLEVVGLDKVVDQPQLYCLKHALEKLFNFIYFFLFFPCSFSLRHS